jgi:uncharacterized SAM-binding protein YcdF (DUF218 family)
MAILAVLGSKLHAHNRMPHVVKARLRKCLELYRPGDRVIVCGGNVCGARCTHTEAYVMKAYLRQRLPADSILLENRSTDTISNIRNLERMVRRSSSPLTVITSAWHLPRVRHICGQRLPGRRIRFAASADRVSAHRRRLERRYLAQLKNAAR